MATQSVHKDRQGPDWPLGLIVVNTPGTPISIMSLVDSTLANDPGNAVGGPILGSAPVTGNEYTERAQQIFFLAYKAGAHGLVVNTGNIYIVRKGVQGAGNRDDYGAMVIALQPGQSFFLASAPLNRDVFSPYRYFIDADNAGDSCLVTLLMQ